LLQQEAGFGIAEIGSLGTAAAAGTALFNLWLGRVRPLHALQLAMGGMILSMLLLIIATDTALVWAAYLLFGLVGTISFLSGGLMAPWVPERTTGFAYGVQGLTLVFSLVIGPAVAGPLYDISAYLPFIVVAVMLAGLLILTARLHLPFIDGHGHPPPRPRVAQGSSGNDRAPT
jgi:MFS family permease